MAAIVTTMPQVVQPKKINARESLDCLMQCDVLPTELLLHYRTFSFQLLFLFLLPGLLSGHLKTNSSPLLQI